MISLAHGATRTVLLTRRWAVKLPGCWRHPGYRWRSLLNGLLANMNEVSFARIVDADRVTPRCCPVVFSLRGGWLVVMPRARPLSDDEWAAFDPVAFCATHEEDGFELPAEAKRCSYGVLRGLVVAIDYGDSNNF